MRTRITSLIPVAALACPAAIAQQEPYAVVKGEAVPVPQIQMGDPATIQRILDEGTNRNQVMDHLRYLCKEIGPRLTGSTNVERANNWTRDKFEEWGLTNAHLWQWGEIPVRFDRGPSSAKVVLKADRRGEVVYEDRREVDFTTLAWVPGTDGPQQGPIVTWPETVSDAKAHSAAFAGAWVLMPQSASGRRGVRGPAGSTSARYQLWRDIANGVAPEPAEEAATPSVPNDGFSGRWEGRTTSESIPGDGYEFVLNLRLEGDGVSGTFGYPGFMEAPLENPKFDRRTGVLTFEWTSPRGKGTYTFTLKDKVLKGAARSEDGSSVTDQNGRWVGTGVEEPAIDENDFRTIMETVLAAGPLGFVSSSGDERVWTSAVGGWRNLSIDGLPTQLEVIVSEPDYDYMNSKVASGWPIELVVNADNRLIEGPIPVYNTIAEIPGVKHPEQVVIVSAHLDSWNGPGSEGTVDNGTGTVVTLEAARILMAAKAKPDRTIRFILWTGEEQGLLGSRAYAEAFRDDLLANCSAVFVDDGGTNYQGGLDLVEPMRDYLAAATAPVNGRFFSQIDFEAAMADEDPANDARAGWMDVNLNILPRMPRGGASDHASFNRIGVPGFYWTEVGRANYRYGWHTQFDRVDQAIEEYLVQSATCTAITAYNLACAPSLLPREQPDEVGAQ